MTRRANPTWVFCGGMFRSASTLQFQITARLVKDAAVGHQIGWIDAYRFAETQQRYADIRGLKVGKVHVCSEPIQEEFLRQNALGLYSYRDIRDVFSSYMKQRQKAFQFLWQEGFLETCLENYKIWTSLPNMLVSSYRDLTEHLPQEVYRIAQHLQIPVSLADCQAIAADYGLEFQQQRIQSFRSQLLQAPLDPDDHREIVDYHDEETLLHMNHIDSAKSGRWQTELSEAEVCLIEQTVQDWCTRNALSPMLFLPSYPDLRLA
ncbi:MAG: sulfotransferase domain-containing protein [Elainella sp.]